MAYKANDVARYAVSRCLKKGNPISNLQLQKIMYYIQGYYLAIYDNPLFEEQICAWKLGPVVPEVYRHFNRFGAEPITEDIQPSQLISLTKGQMDLINAVIDSKSQKSAWQLVNESHKERPWITTPQSEIISTDKIKQYFKEFITSHGQRS
jgi:uncharacterized phage-associated protein